MKIRWLLVAIALAAAMTAIASLSMRSPRGSEEQAPASAAQAGAQTAGCPVKAQPAKLDFTLRDMYGRDVKLADYRGKVVLLNFWATWCAPCREETPGLVDLYARYRKKGLQIVGVSVSDTREQIPPFAREFKVDYPLLVGQDHDDLMETYGATMAIPVSVLIGRTGAICDRHMGLLDLDLVEREIKALL